VESFLDLKKLAILVGCQYSRVRCKSHANLIPDFILFIRIQVLIKKEDDLSVFSLLAGLPLFNG
jgi:hypothetical protein